MSKSEIEKKTQHQMTRSVTICRHSKDLLGKENAVFCKMNEKEKINHLSSLIFLPIVCLLIK